MSGEQEDGSVRLPFRPGGHPLHPATVHLPIGLLTAATLWDAVALWQGEALWWNLAFWCMAAGCAAALPAVATGVLEWLALPRRTDVLRTVNRHIAAASVAVALYTASVLSRGGAAVPEPGEAWLPVALSTIGFASLLAAGWWGGVLVYRLGVASRRRGGRLPGP